MPTVSSVAAAASSSTPSTPTTPPASTTPPPVIELEFDNIIDAGEPEVPATPAAPPPPEVPPSWRVPRPEGANFHIEQHTWDALIYAMTHGKNVLLKGPSGSGKSEVCYLAAQALGLHIEAFNMGAMSEPRTSLIGTTHFAKDRGTWFGESRFVRTVKKPEGVILLDELTRCTPSAYNILIPLLDNQRYLALDESEDSPIIKRGEKIAFCATANIGVEYSGTEVMDEAIKNRFSIIIDMTFPSPDAETKILTAKTGIDQSTAEQLVKFATTQRDLIKTGKFNVGISTRMLLASAEYIKSGVPLCKALNFTVLNHFSDEGGADSERVALDLIVQKFK